MRVRGLRVIPVILAFMAALSAGCGGGGAESGTPQGPVSALTWDPPGTYSDNAVLDPYRDLEYYEVFVRKDANFTDNDVPVALIKAVTNNPSSAAAGMTLETEFVLENLRAFVDKGALYYVSLKAVGVDGQASAFMTPVAWDQRPVAPLL